MANFDGCRKVEGVTKPQQWQIITNFFQVLTAFHRLNGTRTGQYRAPSPSHSAGHLSVAAALPRTGQIGHMELR